MAKVYVQVLNAVVGGATEGQRVEIDSLAAVHLESIGYVKVLEQEKPKQVTKAKDDKKTAENPEKETAKKSKKG